MSGGSGGPRAPAALHHTSSEPPPLPAPWVQHWSKGAGRWYYFNKDTNASVWDRPVPLALSTSTGVRDDSTSTGVRDEVSRPKRALSPADQRVDRSQQPLARGSGHLHSRDHGGGNGTAASGAAGSDHYSRNKGKWARRDDSWARDDDKRHHSTHSTRGGSRDEGASVGTGAGAATRTRTYLPLMEQMNPDVLAALLGPGWSAVDTDTAFRRKYVDLVFLDGFKNFEKRLWSLKCGVKSRILAQSITVKTRLHELLTQHCPGRFIPDTILLPRGRPPTRHTIPPGVWIFRPERKEGSGVGIAVVQTQEQLDAALSADRRDDKRGVIPPILSRYIDRPLLLHDGGQQFKFHMRIYYLVAVFPDRRRNRAALYYNGELARAMKPYVHADYGNKAGHDTHLSDSFKQVRPLVFPSDFPADDGVAAGVFRDIHTCLTEVTRLAVPTLEKYTECSEGGFNLFGCDFMVDEDHKVWLIEINATPGLQRKGFGDAVYQAFSQFIMGGIAEFALAETPVAADQLAHVVPCDEAGARMLATDCAGALQRGTAAFAAAVAQSHKSDLVGAAAGAEHTIVAHLDDVELEAAYRSRLEPAGWAFLTILEAFSKKSATAVLVVGEHTLDKRLTRIDCSVSNQGGNGVSGADLAAAIQHTQPSILSEVVPFEIDGCATDLVLHCVVTVTSAIVHVAALKRGNLVVQPAAHEVGATSAPQVLPFPLAEHGLNCDLAFASACELLALVRSCLGSRVLPRPGAATTGVTLVKARFNIDAANRTRLHSLDSTDGRDADKPGIAAAVCSCALGVAVPDAPPPFILVGEDNPDKN